MNVSEINPDDLNPLKLSLISFGSLAGMGIGLLLSVIITSTFWKVIIAIILLTISISTIIKNIELLK